MTKLAARSAQASPVNRRSHRRLTIAITLSMATILAIAPLGVARSNEDAKTRSALSCLLEVNRLCERALSDSAADGNNGLADLEYLFARLEEASKKRLRASDLSPNKRRALVWGLLRLAPRYSARVLLNFIDSRDRDPFGADSSDFIGNAYPSIAYLRAEGLGALRYVVAAAASESPQPLEFSQRHMVAMAATCELGRDGELLKAYIARFRSEADRSDKLDGIENIARRIVRNERLGDWHSPSKQEVDARWYLPTDAGRPEFPPIGIRINSKVGSKELDSLADDIVCLSDVDASGLGLFRSVFDVVCRRFREKTTPRIGHQPISHEPESVKRAILLLAGLRDQSVSGILAQRIEDRLVVGDPKSDRPFCAISVADACIAYGDGIIETIGVMAENDHARVISDAELDKYVEVLDKACGGSPNDRKFLQLYFDRKVPDRHRSLTLARLRERLQRLAAE